MVDRSASVREVLQSVQQQKQQNNKDLLYDTSG